MKKNKAGSFIFTLFIFCLASYGRAADLDKSSHRTKLPDPRDAVGDKASTDRFEVLLRAKALDIRQAGTVPLLGLPVPEAVPDTTPSNGKNRQSIYVGDDVLVAFGNGAYIQGIGKVTELLTDGKVVVNYNGIKHKDHIVSPKEVYKSVKSTGAFSVGDEVVVAFGNGANIYRIGKVKKLFTNGTVVVNYNYEGIEHNNRVSFAYIEEVYKSIKSIGTFSVGDRVIDAHKLTGRVKKLFANGLVIVDYDSRKYDMYQGVATLSKQ